MNNTRQRELEILAAARSAKPEEREAYLNQACEGDAELRRRIESLLAAQEERDSSQPPLQPTICIVTEQPGDRIGRYKLLQKIGEGGCGVVYMAEQEEPIRRRVALKVIKLGMDTRAVIARFEAERQALALMDHPNIARVFDAGATGAGRPFFVMELVKGVRITEYCDQNNLSTVARLNLFTSVCAAIQHAHQKGIIHRDIKPSNVLVTLHDGVPVPKVIDFGIAKATDQRLTEQTLFTAFEEFIGTPAYMSPEQAEMSGLDIDTRSDIYSLGVLLYELLTGKTPFDAKELLASGLDEMRRTIRVKEPVRPSTRLGTMPGSDLTTVAKHRQTEAPKLVHLVRGDLDWIVMKCLEKDRARRYETANGLAMDLQRHLNCQPVIARPPSAAYRFQKLVRRNKLTFAAGAAVAAALVIGLGVSTIAFFREADARRRAVAAEKAEGVQRQRAESERNLAHTAAQRADAARVQTEQANLSLELERAELLFAQGRAANAYASLARLLRTEPTNRVVAERLLSALSLRNICLPAAEPFPIGEEFQAAQFLPDGRLMAVARTNPAAGPIDPRTGRSLLPEMDPEFAASVMGRVGGASADFSRGFVVGDDNAVTVWDLSARKKLHKLPHEQLIRFGLFNSRNTHLFTYDGSIGSLWNLDSGKLESSLPIELPERSSVVCDFSPDARRFMVVVATNSIFNVILFELATGESHFIATKHQRRIMDVAFSPDSERFVTASMDSTAQLWDARTRRALSDPLRHDHYVQSARFSHDGMTLITASRDNSVRLWDAFHGQPVTDRLEHDSDVYQGVFSTDGRQVFTLSRRKAWVWDLRQGQPLVMDFLHSREVAVAHFSRDGSRVLTSSEDGTARVWDVRTGRPLTKLMPHQSWIHFACFSPDERLVATASPDRTARVWDARTGEPVSPPLQHRSDVRTVHFSPDGARVLTASYDKTARVWEARTGEPLPFQLQHEDALEHAVFSPNGRRILTASRDGTAQLWDAETGERQGEPFRHDGPVANAQFSPDGARVVTASADQTARLWDAATGKPLGEPIRHSDELRHRTPAFSRDGSKVVSIARNEAKVWDGHTGRLLVPPLMHSHRVYSAQFSPDGTRVVTTTADGTARLWDTASGLQVSEVLRHGGKVNAAEFSPVGSPGTELEFAL